MYDENTNKYIGYIYLISNSINNKKYIGQTTQNPKKRFRQHCNEKRDSSMILPRAIRKYGEEHFHMEVLETFECDSKKDLQDILNKTEIKYIQIYNSLKPNGYNVTIGGRNVSNIIYEPVDQYSIDGEFIRTWDSITEANQSLGKDCDSSISRVCRGKGKTAYGYIWRYKGQPLEKYDYENKDRTEIYCFDLNGKLITRYDSWSEIANDYGYGIDKVVDNPYKKLNHRWWSTKPEFGYLGSATMVEVDLYDKTGVFLKTFKSTSVCAEYLGVNVTTVQASCNGRVKIVKNHVARYHGDDFNKYDIEHEYDKRHFAIDVYDINKRYICSFEDDRDASILDGLDNLQNLKQSIQRCCEGIRGSNNGYIFRYKGHDINEFDISINHTRDVSINQYDMDGNFIHTFDCINDIVNFYSQQGIDMKPASLINVCNGAYKSTYGFRWYRESDPYQPDPSRIRTRLNQQNPKAIEYIKNQNLKAS